MHQKTIELLKKENKQLKRELRSATSRLEKAEDKIKDGRDLSLSTIDWLTLLESEVIDLIKSSFLKEELR